MSAAEMSDGVEVLPASAVGTAGESDGSPAQLGAGGGSRVAHPTSPRAAVRGMDQDGSRIAAAVAADEQPSRQGDDASQFQRVVPQPRERPVTSLCGDKQVWTIDRSCGCNRCRRETTCRVVKSGGEVCGWTLPCCIFAHREQRRRAIELRRNPESEAT